MGSGAAKKKYGTAHEVLEFCDSPSPSRSSREPRGASPSYDHDSWRKPRQRKDSRPARSAQPRQREVRSTRPNRPAESPRGDASTWIPLRGDHRVAAKAAAKVAAKNAAQAAAAKAAAAEAADPVRVPDGGSEYIMGSLPNLVPEADLTEEVSKSNSTPALEHRPEGDGEEDATDYTDIVKSTADIWTAVLAKRKSTSKEDMTALFTVRELKDKVEASADQAATIQRRAAVAAENMGKKRQALAESCQRIGCRGRKRATAVHSWQRGDLAMWKGELCEVVSVVDRKREAPSIDIRLVDAHVEQRTTKYELVPLTRPQETALRGVLREYKEAQLVHERMQREVKTVHKDLRRQHRSFSDHVEKELGDMESSADAAGVAAPNPPGLPSMDLVCGWTLSAHEGTPLPAYPNMDRLFSAAQALLKVNGVSTKPQASQVAESTATTAATSSSQTVHSSVENEAETLRNVASCISSQNVQPELQADADTWTAHQDADGNTYYYNQSSGKTAWELPAGSNVIGSDSESCSVRLDPSSSHGLEGVSQPQVSRQPYPAPHPSAMRESVHAHPEEVYSDVIDPSVDLQPEMQNDTSEWNAYQDADGVTYYHNLSSGETSWHLPVGVSATNVGIPCQSGTVHPFAGVPKCTLQPSAATHPLARRSMGSQSYPAPNQATVRESLHVESEGSTTQQPPTTYPFADQGIGGASPAEQVGWSYLVSNPTTVPESLHLRSEDARPTDHPARQQMGMAPPSGFDQFHQEARIGAAFQEPSPAFHSGMEHLSQASAHVSSQQIGQWAEYYMQYWNWFQQQEQFQTSARADVPNDLLPPSVHASVTDQVAYAMKSYILQQMDNMLTQGATLAERKKIMRNWQVQWHPDKNPEQLEVAKIVFQFLGEKKQWFLCNGNETDAYDVRLDVDPMD